MLNIKTPWQKHTVVDQLCQDILFRLNDHAGLSQEKQFMNIVVSYNLGKQQDFKRKIKIRFPSLTKIFGKYVEKILAIA